MRDDNPHFDARDPRVIGAHGDGDGPLVIVVAALHGNETRSIEAAKAVLDTLRSRQIPLGGRLLAVIGNLKALERGVRGVDGDLNRRWRRSRVDRLRAGTLPLEDNEDREQAALVTLFDRAIHAAHGPVVGLDLHSFSSIGAPFSVTLDDPIDIALAARFGWPAILRLEAHLRGTILEFFRDDGHRAVGLEAGTHADPRTAWFHEMAIWRTLVGLEMVDDADVPEQAERSALMRRAGLGLPSVVEVVYRHAIGGGDQFLMRPGFRNLQPVFQGQTLADDVNGIVYAPQSGWLLMPLYGQGNDGFFIATER